MNDPIAPVRSVLHSARIRMPAQYCKRPVDLLRQHRPRQFVRHRHRGKRYQQIRPLSPRFGQTRHGRQSEKPDRAPAFRPSQTSPRIAPNRAACPQGPAGSSSPLDASPTDQSARAESPPSPRLRSAQPASYNRWPGRWRAHLLVFRCSIGRFSNRLGRRLRALAEATACFRRYFHRLTLAPEPFQIVISPSLRGQGMNHEIAIIRQYPLGRSVSFHT